MKTIKIIILIIGVIVIIPLAMAIFIDKEYDVKREIIIDKSKAEVFDFVRHLKNQEKYSVWVRMDPEMKKDFSGTDGSEGCVYAWDGEKAGKGEQEIIQIVEGERIEAQLRFIKPFESIAYTHMLTEEVSPGQTKVTWGMEGESKYPMNFMNLFMNRVLGGDIAQSLSTLKEVMEKDQASMK